MFQLFPLAIFFLLNMGTIMADLGEDQTGRSAMSSNHFCQWGGVQNGGYYFCFHADFTFDTDNVKGCAVVHTRVTNHEIGCGTQKRGPDGNSKFKALSGDAPPPADWICLHSPVPDYYMCVDVAKEDDKTTMCAYYGKLKNPLVKLGCSTFANCEGTWEGC